MEPKLTDLADLAPSGDFALNAFLLELNDDLTDEDLEKLKFLCKGKYGIGKQILEKVQKPIDLFDILREKELLNEMNIITLQAMLWTLPRRDLQRKYVEFAESVESSVHFIVPREISENGYKYLKFHIRGADLDTYKKKRTGKTSLDDSKPSSCSTGFRDCVWYRAIQKPSYYIHGSRLYRRKDCILATNITDCSR